MGIEKEPTPEHEEEFEEIEVVGDVELEEFSGMRDRLSPGEHIDIFVGLKPRKKGGKNLLTVTDKRLLTFTSGKTKLLGEKSEFEDIRVDDIENINVEERKDFDVLNIDTEKEEKKFMLPEGTGVKVAGHIRDMQGETPAERIEALGEQRDKGNISDEEFEEKKEELMDRI